MGLIAGKAAPKKSRVMMVGLDAGGKTAILYRMVLGDVVVTIPTTGYNWETLTYKGLQMDVIDTASRDKIRPLWRHFMDDLQAVIYVIDSIDRDRLPESAEVLSDSVLFEDNPANVYLLLCNKRDLPNAMSPHEILAPFDVATLNARARWKLMLCSATTGEGLAEAFDWLSTAVREQAANPRVGCESPEYLSKEWRERLMGTSVDSSAAMPSGGAVSGAGAGAGAGAPTSEATSSSTRPTPSLIENASRAPVDPATPVRTLAYQPETLPGAAAMPQRDTDSTATATMTDAELATHVSSGGSDDIVDARSTLSHEDMIRFIHHHLSTIERGTSGRKVAVDAILAGLRTYYDAHRQIYHLTYIYFWIQLVDLALHRPIAQPDPAEGISAAVAGPSIGFKQLIVRNPYLMNDLLVLEYYTRELMFHTPKAMEEFTLPDIKALPSVLNFNIGRAQ